MQEMIKCENEKCKKCENFLHCILAMRELQEIFRYRYLVCLAFLTVREKCEKSEKCEKCDNYRTCLLKTGQLALVTRYSVTRFWMSGNWVLLDYWGPETGVPLYNIFSLFIEIYKSHLMQCSVNRNYLDEQIKFFIFC